MNKIMKKVRYAVAVPLTLAAGAVLAEVPAEVTTAVSTAKTDAVLVAGSVLAIIAAIFGIMMIRRVLR